jgi:hypothetical protein
MLLVGAAALGLLAGHTSAQSLEGEYHCKGSDANGGNPYSGTVTLKKDGPVYGINWELGKGGDYTGTAILDNVLAGAYGDGQPYGLAVYRINGGTLSGQWVAGGKNNPGTEVLQGAKELEGAYQITSAKSPEGKPYGGTVTITKNGEAYTVDWTLPEERHRGVGIRHGDFLVVGWGQGAGYGAVVYDAANGRLTGQWTSAAGGPLGAETLTRK